MWKDKKEFEFWKSTFESITDEDFYINQNIKIDSFWKCPWCEKETLNLENRICECWYNLEHEIPKNIGTLVDEILEKPNNILNYWVCICWNKMW